MKILNSAYNKILMKKINKYIQLCKYTKSSFKKGKRKKESGRKNNINAGEA